MTVLRNNRNITLKDSSEVTLCVPKLKDAESLMKMMNDIVREESYIAKTEPILDVEQEKAILKNNLKLINNNEMVMLVAKANAKVVGSVEIKRGQGTRAHIGELSINIAKEYRGRGLGQLMTNSITELGKKILELNGIILKVSSLNERAINLYKSAGFKEVGAIPNGRKRNCKYSDDIIMHKELK